ncbi:MAG: hypothetical protein KBE04_14315 [Phycisphaerae bacterium]|nr:hypothetical protein [Phycisphaerae bacterium]
MNGNDSDRTASWWGRIPRQELILDLAAFGVTVLLAAVLRWQAKDLIWGLWISSLCVGYAHILVSILLGARTTGAALGPSALAGGLLLVGFFTVHFGSFHFGHSVFLNEFFPLVEGDSAYPGFKAILEKALGSYWPFVLVNLWYRWRDFPKERLVWAQKDALIGPYLNVIRMHILIFVFAGLHALRLGNLAIYPVLAAYFFPWGSLFRRAQTEASDVRGPGPAARLPADPRQILRGQVRLPNRHGE